MKRIWRSLPLVLVMIMIAGMIQACGSSQPKQETKTESAASEPAKQEEKPVTLTVMGNQSDTVRPYMKTAFANYEEKTGNKLDIQPAPADSSERVMQTKFAAGDIPDIFMHFGGHSLAAFNPEKNFVDFSNAFWVEDILPYVKSQTIYKGKVYGLPHWEASISGFLYNKEIFGKLNIPVPTTVTEFDAACKKLQDAGITPIYLAFKDTWPLIYQFAVDTMVQDTATLEKLNTNQIKYADIPEFKKMVQWYKDIADKGYIGEKFTTNTWDYAPEALNSGKYAIMIGWDTYLYTDLDVKYPGLGDKFGIMPAFQGTPEQGTFEGPNCSLLFAHKNSKNAQAATEFVNFMGTPENYNIAFKDVSTAPVFKGQTTHKATPQYTEAKAMLDKVGTPSIAWSQIIGFTQVEGGKFLQEVMLGGKTVDQCIEAMDADRMKIAKAQQIPGF